MKRLFWLLFMPSFAVTLSGFLHTIEPSKDIVVKTQQIILEDFPGAFNPSIIEVPEGFLLSFRYGPDLKKNPLCSYIGVVLLDKTFQPLQEPYLLNTRLVNYKVQSQAEDARLFRYRGSIYLIYNDCADVNNPTTKNRRDMYIAELIELDGSYVILPPQKLRSKKYYPQQYWQKNWVPFSWNDRLYVSYTLYPHEVLYVDLEKGLCDHFVTSTSSIKWDYGCVRGSSIPEILDEEYFAFFHSGRVVASKASSNVTMWHYFVGAYTFFPKPPFSINKISKVPIVSEGFYTESDREKRVIFPGGFVTDGEYIYLAYGKDDAEMWIATLDRAALKKSLVSVRGKNVKLDEAWEEVQEDTFASLPKGKIVF